jgi:hypothetical protein
LFAHHPSISPFPFFLFFPPPLFCDSQFSRNRQDRHTHTQPQTLGSGTAFFNGAKQ